MSQKRIPKNMAVSAPLLATLSQNLKKIMAERNLTQTAIISMCNEENLHLAQATISNVIRGCGNITLDTISVLAHVLETDVSTLLTQTNDGTSNTYVNSITPGASLITDPEDAAFNGYLNDYTVLFFKTSGNAHDLLHGTLSLKKSSNNQICEATFSLPTGETKTINDQYVDIKKEYKGQMYISKYLRTAYIMLFNNKNIGEICFLVFSHWHILNNNLKCAMASAFTTSSGSNRRPTMHRACLINGHYDQTLLPFIKGQLLLNSAEIIISQSELDKLYNNSKIPSEFRKLLQKATCKEKYCLVKENQLMDSHTFSEKELAMLISHIRSKSIAPKHNKISKRTDEMLFELLS